MKLRSRALIVVAAAAAVVAPIGGAPASAADVAATVNGADITVDDLDDALAQSAGQSTENVAIDGATVRRALGNLIQQEILAGAGVDLEATDNPVAALVDAGLYDDSAARAAYEDGAGIANGQICAYILSFDTEDDAADAVDEIDDTEGFRAYAQENQLQTAGLSMDGAGPCGPADGLIEDVAEPVTGALADAGIDAPTEPIEIQDRFFVLIAPPFDEVATTVDGEAINEVVSTLLRDADVTINPRYGRWNGADGTVVELDAPDAPVATGAAVAG